MAIRLKTTFRRLVAFTAALGAGVLVWTAWIETELAPPAEASQTREWRTAAPGIVEARVAEVRLASAVQARIVNIAVKPGDRSLKAICSSSSNQEEAARVRMAEANVTLRKFERDNASKNADTTERRKAEDAVAKLEAAVRDRQAEYDAEALTTPRTDADRERSLADARTALTNARAALQKEKQALSKLKDTASTTSTSQPDAARRQWHKRNSRWLRPRSTRRVSAPRSMAQ